VAIRDFFDEAYIPEPNSGCWLWLRGCSTAGYGQLSLAGKVVYAHRFSYERKYGPLEPDACVLHRCDNPICVNSDHLFVGSKTDNNRDMAKKGRVKGQKLSAADVIAIRADMRIGREIARDYGVSKTHVDMIKARTVCGHIGDGK
jgi:hypothetical protein